MTLTLYSAILLLPSLIPAVYRYSLSLLAELEPSFGAFPFRGKALNGFRIADPLTGFNRDIVVLTLTLSLGHVQRVGSKLLTETSGDHLPAKVKGEILRKQSSKLSCVFHPTLSTLTSSFLFVHTTPVIRVETKISEEAIRY